VAGPEFAPHVGSGFSRESDTSGRCTATSMEGSLGDGTSSCMPRKSTHGGLTLSALGIAGDHCARQRMSEPGTKAPLRGTVVMEVFMKWRGHRVFNSSFYSMGCESCA
jgi:hypothetical protein